SLHTAQAFQWTPLGRGCPGWTARRGSRFGPESTFVILINGRHARQSLCRVRDAPIDGRRSSFAFLSENGSIEFLTTKDQIDVGISARLQDGFGLFDPLHAVSPEATQKI